MPAYELKSAVNKIAHRRLNFALFKGQTGDHVLITAKAPGAMQLAALKKEIGDAKRLAKGVCFFEDGVLTFATRLEPNSSWEPTTNKIFRAHECAKFQPVKFRQLAAEESDEVELSDDDDAAPQPSLDGAPPPIGTEHTQPTADAAQDQFTHRLRQVLELVNQATAAKLPGAPEAKLKLSEAAQLASKKEFQQGLLVLDEAEKLLAGFKAPTTVSPTTRPETATPPPPPTPPPPGNEQTIFGGRLKAILPDLKHAIDGGLPGAAELKDLVTKASTLAKAGDYQSAFAALAEAEKRLANANPTDTPTSTATGGVVLYRQARLAWDQVRKKVYAEIQKLQKQILEEVEFAENYDEIAANCENLYEALEVLDERLIDKLDEAINEGDAAKRKALEKEAHEILLEYIDYVNSDELMQDIDGNNGFTTVAVKSTFEKTLKVLAEKLKAQEAAA